MKLDLKLDLGIRKLLPEWAKLLKPEGLKQDVIAGMTVACVAIPLSLAIALASKVEPAVGLVTAIVAGILCAFFGGTPLSVSGPAAAMAVLIASCVDKFGLPGLLVVGIGCGILQLLSGVLGLGKLIRFVPVPVVAGFTAGIGAIILVGQLPRAFGLPPAPSGHFMEVLKYVANSLHDVQYIVFGVTLLTVLITKLLPRFFSKLPAPLIAVVVPSLLVAVLGLDVPLIGEIPNSLPLPKFPVFPETGWGELLGSAVIVFILASLETLLSSTAVDKMSKTKHDPDQELIGQGLGNLCVTLFGGIPVTGVIARSALNVKAGAYSRRSSIFHSLALMATVFLFASIISRIPVAALSGVLIAIALSMLSPKEFLHLVRFSKSEASVYLVTFFVIVTVDLIAGVEAGVVAALIIAVFQLGKNYLHWHPNHHSTLQWMSLSGPLTFLSSTKIDQLEKQILALVEGSGTILDLSEVTALDSTGASNLIDLITSANSKGIRVILKGLQPRFNAPLTLSDHDGILKNRIAATESEAIRILDSEDLHKGHKLVSGVNRFRRNFDYRYKELFDILSEEQNPHTLFVTCSDSRINPNLITTTDPGELFIVRNVGNIIPKCGTDSFPAEGAAIEYAVGVLGIKEIVICGHTNCGAMAAIVNGKDLSGLPSVASWLSEVTKMYKDNKLSISPDEAARRNVVLQLENLNSYSVVSAKIKAGEIKVRAWIYDIKEAELLEWNSEKNIFLSLNGKNI